MPDIIATYEGQKRVLATNPRSGRSLTFDQAAPKGRGESYDPVEGLMASLAGCTMTMIAYAAEANGLDIQGASIQADCKMVENPHRIGSVELIVDMPPVAYTDTQKKVIQKYAERCPVGMALADSIEKKLVINWPA